MKMFALRLFCYCLLLIFLMLVGLIIPRFTPHQNLHYALIDKHKLLSQGDTSRIVLVGGSNLSFGINSKKIESTFHKNVINTSIHAGLGLKYILEDITPFIKRGDLVIVVAEYDHFFGDVLWGYEPMVSSVFAIPANYSMVNFQNWKEMVSAVPKESLKNILKFFVVCARKVIGSDVVGIYDRDSFNDHGDVITHYSMRQESFVSNDIDETYNPLAIQLLKNFENTISARGATLLIGFPSLNEASCIRYPHKIEKIYGELKKENFNLLGSPKRYCLNDTLFFNAKYHLTLEGVNIRTSFLIDDLNKVITKK